MAKLSMTMSQAYNIRSLMVPSRTETLNVDKFDGLLLQPQKMIASEANP
jgi:hypothetical protein